jgi:hypothetical protein
LSSIWYLQPVCHAAAAACRPPCAVTGRRACAPMANQSTLRFGLADASP